MNSRAWDDYVMRVLTVMTLGLLVGCQPDNMGREGFHRPGAANAARAQLARMNIEMTDEEYETRVSGNDTEVVRLFHAAGFERGRSMGTHLGWASAVGDLALVKFLVAENPSHINLVTDGHPPGTPLIYASMAGHVAVAKFLLDNGAKVSLPVRVNVEGKTLDLETPLTAASREGHVETMALLLRYGADVNAGDPPPLSVGALYGNEAVVRFLLSKGADVHAQSVDGWTAVTMAGKCGHIRILRLLLEHGFRADSHCGSEELLAVVDQAADEPLQAIRLLIKHGAKAKTPAGNAALIKAAELGYTKTAILLLRHGADPTFKAANGDSALSWALLRKDTELAKHLKAAAGADK